MLDPGNGIVNTLLGDLHLVGDPPFSLIGSNASWSRCRTVATGGSGRPRS